MPDLSLEWYDDLQLTNHGDLAVVDGADFVRQRIERRLFTAVKGYVWHLDYGAGLLQKVGGAYTPFQIQSLVRWQLSLEDSVAQAPPPTIKVSAQPGGGQIIEIDYFEAPSGRQVGITITV